MQRRIERGKDGKATARERPRSAPSEVTRGRGAAPEENDQEIQEQSDVKERRSDFKDDRRVRPRDRHE